ncbi:hypothetical protein IWQ60_006929 [Tieghemiomyces parasiticus]|uniref:tRNA-dihydrouridine synthase n=1 Tax=Tieghemiomyces parasiticus TaxID=78921 RepID=A0A9W8A147_9FUNG|nr:hypothetical protein IWQ60_006929 [Tieghemiomyces parasiticus]
MGPVLPNLVVQLGGSEPEFMARAAEVLQAYGAPAINLNLGCPSQNVQNSCFGATLMKDPERVVAICQAINAATDLPLSIKCRIGVDHQDTDQFLHDFIHAVTSQTRVTEVILHARKALLKNIPARKNLTVPPLNYNRVYGVATAFPHLRIILNGGIASVDAVRQGLDRVDGVMLGRKMMHDPLFLVDIDREIYGQPVDRTSVRDKILPGLLDYLDAEQASGVKSVSLLTRPVQHMYENRLGRTFRGILARRVSRRAAAQSVRVSTLVRECLEEARTTVAGSQEKAHSVAPVGPEPQVVRAMSM